MTRLSISGIYKLLFLFTLVILGATACTPSSTRQLTQWQNGLEVIKSDSVFISLTAANLSEDMSRILSTKNDELLVLIYEYRDSTTLNAPLFQQAFTVREKDHTYHLFFEQAKAADSKNLLFLLIEQDFDRPIEQIDPVVRVQHKDLLAAFKRRDYDQIRRYLGSEDLLGYWMINDFDPDKSITHKIEGVYKLDWYDYTIEIGKR